MESHLTAEISASAVRENLALLKGCLESGAKLCAVVKADCYGHGVETLLDVIGEEADLLAVTTPAEALGLRELGWRGPVLMFFTACAHGDGAETRDALVELIRRDITLTVVAPQEVLTVAEAAAAAGRDARVHVKIDTGMTRSGAVPQTAPAIIEHIRRQAGVNLAGFYTHFAVADEADKSFTRLQLAIFRETLTACGDLGGAVLHAANSAATIDLQETHLDMVRPGIAMYGYQPSDNMQNRLPLRPCMRLIGRLMQVKEVPAGSRTGYGLTCRLDRDSRVGLVPVGYADGYLRCLSNLSSMRVGGRDVPVLGRVSMDQTVIDLTDVPQARVGDEVEIISPDPAAPHSVENLARLAGTISYEVTCRLGERIRRVLVD